MKHHEFCVSEVCCCLAIEAAVMSTVGKYEATWQAVLTSVGGRNYAKGYMDAINGKLPKVALGRAREL